MYLLSVVVYYDPSSTPLYYSLAKTCRSAAVTFTVLATDESRGPTRPARGGRWHLQRTHSLDHDTLYHDLKSLTPNPLYFSNCERLHPETVATVPALLEITVFHPRSLHLWTYLYWTLFLSRIMLCVSLPFHFLTSGVSRTYPTNSHPARQPFLHHFNYLKHLV